MEIRKKKKVLLGKKRVKVQNKPLGETVPNIVLPVEKMEQKPNITLKQAGGVNLVKPLLQPIDLVEPSNLGLTEHNANRDIFKTVETLPTQALIQKKNVDEMSVRELFGQMFSNTKVNLSNKLSEYKNKITGKIINVKQEVENAIESQKKGFLQDYFWNPVDKIISHGTESQSFCDYCYLKCKKQ